MPNEQSKIDEIVLAAAAITSPKERAAFLVDACGDDLPLRERIEQLLSRHKGRSYSDLPDNDADATLVADSSSAELDQTYLTHMGPIGVGESIDVDDSAESRINAQEETIVGEPHDASTMLSLDIPDRDVGGRYRMDGEIARGGMGAVWRGYDVDLCRDIAIKVLLEKHEDNSEILQRFVEEAQIAGQLQHPGIAPVYEFGKLQDRRPFFSMKLIRGETLAALLAARVDPPADRSRFVGIFEQVCQTMAYAHSRRVVHRDLKPANIMVGAFGEVQVMDWGVAKVLIDTQALNEAPAAQKTSNDPSEAAGKGKEKWTDEQSGQSLVQTRRSGSLSPKTSHTMMGAVMGTPAYMPPEQALGEIDQLDERADVFGLGAILCEILTGQPPYVGDNGTTIFRMAKRGKLDECFSRLDSCGADAELVELARHCLASDPGARPRDASVLAQRVTDYMESVEARLRETEKARAAQEARADEERKRRRVTLALAASIMITLGLGGGAWNWSQRQATHRRNVATTKVNEALADARLHQALADGADPADEDGLRIQVEELDEAVRRADQAAELARDEEVDEQLQIDADKALAALQKQADAVREKAVQAANDRAFSAELDLIRLSQADRVSEVDPKNEVFDIYDLFDVSAAASRYEQAFHDAGLDLAKLDVTDSADQIRKSSIRESIIAGLDNWIRSMPKTDGETNAGKTSVSRKELLQIVESADSSEWRKQLRTALDSEDAERLKELATSDDVQLQLPELIAWLGAALRDAKEFDTSIVVLRKAHQQHLGDFWLNFELGKTLIANGETLEGLGHTRAAVAKRPKSSGALLGLANALWTTRRYEQASAVYRVAVDLDPSDPFLHQCLAYAYGKQGQLDEAIAEYRQVIQLDSTLADAHNNLGAVLKQRGDVDDAIAEYREAIALDHQYSMAHSNLGNALVEKEGMVDEAIAEYLLAIEFDDKNFDAHYNLGTVYAKKGELVLAINEFRAAIDLRPSDNRVQSNLDLLMTRALLRGISVPPAKKPPE